MRIDPDCQQQALVSNNLYGYSRVISALGAVSNDSVLLKERMVWLKSASILFCSLLFVQCLVVAVVVAEAFDIYAFCTW